MVVVVTGADDSGAAVGGDGAVVVVVTGASVKLDVGEAVTTVHLPVLAPPIVTRPFGPASAVLRKHALRHCGGWVG